MATATVETTMTAVFTGVSSFHNFEAFSTPLTKQTRMVHGQGRRSQVGIKWREICMVFIWAHMVHVRTHPTLFPRQQECHLQPKLCCSGRGPRDLTRSPASAGMFNSGFAPKFVKFQRLGSHR